MTRPKIGPTIVPGPVIVPGPGPGAYGPMEGPDPKARETDPGYKYPNELIIRFLVGIFWKVFRDHPPGLVWFTQPWRPFFGRGVDGIISIRNDGGTVLSVMPGGGGIGLTQVRI